ncbi:unnamed protein product [Toxocara canis]|nr:unnamed protein product [Toxocara canis]
MVGPKRGTDRDAVLNDGVLLAISQLLLASTPPKNRPRRQAPFNPFTMNSWPVEFDHLQMPQGDHSRILASPLDPFAGIELDIGQSVDSQPQAKEILIESVSATKSTKQTDNDGSTFQ